MRVYEIQAVNASKMGGGVKRQALIEVTIRGFTVTGLRAQASSNEDNPKAAAFLQASER